MLRFDGNDYLNSGDLFYSDSLSVSIFIKPLSLDPAGDFKNILVKGNSKDLIYGTLEWIFCYGKEGILFRGYSKFNEVVVNIQSPFVLPINTEVHLGVIVPSGTSGKQSQLYINKVLNTTGTRKVNPIINTTSCFQIGAGWKSARFSFAHADIRRIAVWNKAITPAQMIACGDLTKYNSDLTQDPALKIENANLQFYLPLHSDSVGSSALGKTVVDLSSFKRSFVGSTNATALLYQKETLPAPPTPTIDTVPPSIPTGFKLNVISSSQIDLSWNASTDNIKVAGYCIFRNGVEIGWTHSTTYQDKNLTPNTIYKYSIVSYDTSSILSGQTTELSGKTLSVPSDSTKPQTPTGLLVTNINDTQLNLSWNPTSDNIAVTGYNVFRGGVGLIGKTAGTTFNDTGLIPDTTYFYTVQAYDAAGNLSEPCEPAYNRTSNLPFIPPSYDDMVDWFKGIGL